MRAVARGGVARGESAAAHVAATHFFYSMSLIIMSPLFGRPSVPPALPNMDLSRVQSERLRPRCVCTTK